MTSFVVGRAVIRRVLFLEGLQPEKDMSEKDLEFPERRKYYILVYFADRHLKHENGERRRRANKEKEPVTAYHACEEDSTTPVCRE